MKEQQPILHLHTYTHKFTDTIRADDDNLSDIGQAIHDCSSALAVPLGCRHAAQVVTPMAVVVPVHSSEKHYQTNCKPVRQVLKSVTFGMHQASKQAKKETKKNIFSLI